MANTNILLFNKFQTEVKKVKIKALDNAEISIREQSVSEVNDFYKKVVKNVDKSGKPEVDINAMMDVRLEKVAACMVEPKMTVDELKALSSKANDAINEIAEEIDKLSGEGK